MPVRSSRILRPCGPALGAGALLLALAGPVSAHASFPAASNTVGTTTDPYPAGSTQTIKMHVPFEQEGVLHNGAVNTTVDVKITAPTGWTGAGCGEARRADLSTVVSGWTCAVSAVGGRQVMAWAGPQVAAGQDAEAGMQYLTFTVTVPSPAAVTSYGGTGSAADGFRVVQKYADGATSTWRTPNDTSGGEVANGLVRTVAAAGDGGPTPTPAPSTPATPTPTPEPTGTATPGTTATPVPSPSPTAGAGTSGGQVVVADVGDDLPKAGPVSEGILLAAAGVLAVGLILLGCSIDVTGRRE